MQSFAGRDLFRKLFFKAVKDVLDSEGIGYHQNIFKGSIETKDLNVLFLNEFSNIYFNINMLNEYIFSYPIVLKEIGSNREKRQKRSPRDDLRLDLSSKLKVNDP